MLAISTECESRACCQRCSSSTFPIVLDAISCQAIFDEESLNPIFITWQRSVLPPEPHRAGSASSESSPVEVAIYGNEFNTINVHEFDKVEEVHEFDKVEKVHEFSKVQEVR